jgi:hypothetical protein
MKPVGKESRKSCEVIEGQRVCDKQAIHEKLQWINKIKIK